MTGLRPNAGGTSHECNFPSEVPIFGGGVGKPSFITMLHLVFASGRPSCFRRIVGASLSALLLVLAALPSRTGFCLVR